VGGGAVLATPRLAARLAELRQPLVVAADVGAVTALRLGFPPSVVVGDFDSIDPAALADLQRQGVSVEAYPRDKDATDGQIAVERALASQVDELVLVGFLGGPRLDQELANVLLLTRVPVPAVLVDGANECRVLRGGQAWAWAAEPGELVSLLPLGSDVQGVSTEGLRWTLDHEALVGGDTRGVSNEPVADQVSVRCSAGLLLVTRYFPE
jgi:thiamine pyrophosphokinase